MTAFASGLLFGLGLALSGMTNPEKIYGFLDFFGSWDPTLAFVMGGAVATHSMAVHLVKRDGRSICRLGPSAGRTTIRDSKLVLGAVLFGIGWGLGGYCPGPALVSAADGGRQPLIFLGSLAFGILSASKAADAGPDRC